MKLLFGTPALQHDAMMLERFGRPVHVRGQVERYVVWQLGLLLAAAGWIATSVYGGDEPVPVDGILAAMELVFDLDEALVFFTNAKGEYHWVYLVLGNGDGDEVISDWSYAHDDPDGFDALMEQFTRN